MNDLFLCINDGGKKYHPLRLPIVGKIYRINPLYTLSHVYHFIGEEYAFHRSCFEPLKKTKLTRLLFE